MSTPVIAASTVVVTLALPTNDAPAIGRLTRRGVVTMALMGMAAAILSFEVASDTVDEHDDWHTHEHLPERLAIPGFLRGTRWVALDGSPRYFVLYEVEALATLSAAPYVERLNNPTPWTSKMMTHYRGMTRGFCALTGSFGSGVGQAALWIRCKPAESLSERLREWLVTDALPRLPSLPGLGSAHLLEAAATPPSTNEQRIRGVDATLDCAVLAIGYSAAHVSDVVGSELSEARLRQQGAEEYAAGVYRMDYSLTHRG